jgi:uncharacterized protein (UPF0303 family)
MDLSRDQERIEHQERELTFPKFGVDTAWQLGQQIRQLAVDRRLPVVIDVRYFAQSLFYSALPGSVPDNAEWVRRKSNTVARFHRSSYAVGLTLRQGQTTLLERYALPIADFAAHGGSFPIHVNDVGVIGAVTVSGLPQRADRELVVEALCLELGRDYGSLALSKVEGRAASDR